MNDDDEIWTLETMFGSNARKIVESEPPHETAQSDQLWAKTMTRMANFTPEEDAEMARHAQQICDDIDAMTPNDWADLDAELAVIERIILRQRGIEPD